MTVMAPSSPSLGETFPRKPAAERRGRRR